MLSRRDELFAKKFKGIGICGRIINRKDVFELHVGLFWIWENDSKVIHWYGNAQQNYIIETVDLNLYKFQIYYFVEIQDFPKGLIDSFIALAELLPEKQLKNLQLPIKDNIIYRNGKFEYITEGYIVVNESEKRIDCIGFIYSLLNAYNYKLVDLSTWPILPEASSWEEWLNLRKFCGDDRKKYADDRKFFLNCWLDKHNISAEERKKYSLHFKGRVLGKHLLVCPLTPSTPTPYTEAIVYADRLVAFLSPSTPEISKT